jgi:type VII secretion ATPase EccA
MSPSAFEALEAGLLALGYRVRGQHERTDKANARKILGVATSADPSLADAWLVRLSSGDQSLAVYEGLWRSRDTIGAGLARLGLQPSELKVSYDSGLLVSFPLISSDAASAAYVAALTAAGRYADAIAVGADGVAKGLPLAVYAATAVYVVTERWHQVIETVRPLREYQHDPLLASAARAVTIQAMTNLGLHQTAIDLAQQSVAGKLITDHLPLATATVKYHVAMSYRALSREDLAQEALLCVLVAEPNHEAAREMLTRPDLGIKTVDPTVIDSRTDPWDPATAVDPLELERERMATRRGELLAEAEAELAAQIGLHEVKRRVGKLRASVRVNQARVVEGLPPTTRSNHLAFEGPPGTGKTTIARVVAKFYCGLGILPTDKVKEVRKADLVGQYLGDTEKMTNKAIDDALGGVLFLDEAYTLATSGSKNDFGLVAIDVLLARMENERDNLVVIAAGYPEEMQVFYAANEGMRSRFGTIISFPSYDVDELLAIAETVLATTKHRFDPSVAPLLGGACSTLKSHTAKPPLKSHEPEGTVKTPRPQIDIVGNGRFMRTVVEEAITEQQFRLEPLISAGEKVDHSLLTVHDTLAALKTVVPREFQEAISWP